MILVRDIEFIQVQLVFVNDNRVISFISFVLESHPFISCCTNRCTRKCPIISIKLLIRFLRMRLSMRVKANVCLYFVNHHPQCESLRFHQFGYWFTHLSENHWVVKSTQFTFREYDDGNVDDGDDDNDDNATTTNHHSTTYCAHSINSTVICHSQPRYQLFNYKNQQLIYSKQWIWWSNTWQIEIQE